MFQSNICVSTDYIYKRYKTFTQTNRYSNNHQEEKFLYYNQTHTKFV